MTTSSTAGEWLASDLVGCTVPGLGARHAGGRRPRRARVLELEDGTLDPVRLATRSKRVDIEAREIQVRKGSCGVRIDVFTLFPHWFDWFTDAAPRANALAPATSSSSSTCARPRRSAGQVDDTPYGGGAGMVIRVDVVEAALRDRYGAGAAARTGRGAGAGRAPVRRRAGRGAGRGGAAHPALRPLRGLRRARARAPGDRLVSIGPYVLAGASWRRWSSRTR